jgi:hypothetical protein
MELVERTYSERDWTPILLFIIGIAAFILLFFQWDILEALNIESHFRSGMNFSLGALFGSSLSLSLITITRPKIHICNYYLSRHRGMEEATWDQVTEVEKKGNYLILRTPEVQFQKKIRISLSKVKEREEIVKDVEKICEIKGIPFTKH